MQRDEPREEATWGRGTIVSLTRLPGRDHPAARPIGIGELMTRLEVGNPIQIRLDARDGGRLLAATSIVRLEAIAPDTVRIATRNHRYELRRISASLALAHLPHASIDPPSAAPRSTRPDETQVVESGDWPEAAPDRFEQGARVRLVQEREGEVRELGSATLLTDIVPGQPASFGVEGRIVATSPVRSVVEIGKSAVRLVTGNSIYTLELETSGSDD
ncbi:MAG: hypothetical protein R3F21_02930 [Myxococcota bacterium]